MQPLSGNQRPDLLTSLWWTCVLYCACHSKCIFADPLQMSHACHRFWTCYKTLTFSSLLWRCTIPCACHAKRHLNVQKWSEPGVLCTFWLRDVLRATTASTFSTSQLPKVVRTWCALYILTSKCASRHNGVHFFDISTSKSGPNLVRFVHFDFEMCFAPQRRALFRHLNFQKWSEPGLLCTFWLRDVLRATTACTFSTSQFPKVVRTWCALYILTSKCASRHNGVHFFDISTSKSGPNLVRFVHFDFEMCFAPQRRALFSTSQLPKVVRTWCVLYILTSKCASRHNGVHFFDISISKSGPNLVCFVHFDFEMCFAPQRRALFRHLNFQKWSEPGVLCTFWLRNVLRATTACTFSTSQLPKVVRTWCALYILTSKCASRHNGVQLFISHLARWLRTRRFSESTFRPSGATNHWKNTVFRDFPTFSRICIFFLLALSLLWSSLFYSSLLSDSSQLCFSSVLIVGSLLEVWLLNFLRLFLFIYSFF